MRKYVGLLGLFLFGLMGCNDYHQTTDGKQAAKQEQLAAEADAQVGMPGITRFTEKRVLRQIYEKRDEQGLKTYAYLVDMNGRLHHVCNSIGYGFPYGTQYTSPEKDIYYSTSSTVHHNMPQPEPNGLFMPPTADGTWVQCIVGEGKIEPFYIEPHVLVSPVPLAHVDSYEVK